MQHRGSRLESDSFAATEDESFHSELSEAGSPLLDSVARGKDAISAITAEAMNSAGSDLTALRADLNGLKDTSRILSQVSSEAAKSAREVTSSVADRVGGVLCRQGSRNDVRGQRAGEDGRV